MGAFRLTVIADYLGAHDTARTWESPPLTAFFMLLTPQLVHHRRLMGIICFNVLLFSTGIACFRCPVARHNWLRWLRPRHRHCGDHIQRYAWQCGNPAFNIRQVHAFCFAIYLSVSDAVAILGTADLAI